MVKGVAGAVGARTSGVLVGRAHRAGGQSVQAACGSVREDVHCPSTRAQHPALAAGPQQPPCMGAAQRMRPVLRAPDLHTHLTLCMRACPGGR